MLLDNSFRCSRCSISRLKGRDVKQDELNGIKDGDKLTEYKLNTETLKDYFCSVCGIYTHHQGDSKLDEYGVNVDCIDIIYINQLQQIFLLHGGQASQ